VLDLHNSDMTEDSERVVVDVLRKQSELVLLGSAFGRKDHRVRGDPVVEIDGAANKVRVEREHNRRDNMGAMVAPGSPHVPAHMRGHEQF
jgi:hypothetical protein